MHTTFYTHLMDYTDRHPSLPDDSTVIIVSFFVTLDYKSNSHVPLVVEYPTNKLSLPLQKQMYVLLEQTPSAYNKHRKYAHYKLHSLNRLYRSPPILPNTCTKFAYIIYTWVPHIILSSDANFQIYRARTSHTSALYTGEQHHR